MIEGQPPDRSRTRRNTAVMIAVTLAVYCLCVWYPELMTLAGVSHYGVWFMDTYAILAALDAMRVGLDPFAYNPLNHFGGPHVYTHWWFWLEPLGLTRADTLWLGGAVSGLGVLTAWLVLRPRTGRELAHALLILCSAPLVLGLNRANADLLLFVLFSLCVPALLSPHRWLRITGAPLLIALGVGLKFYPAAAGLIVLAIQPARDRWLALAVLVLAVLLVGVSVAPDLSYYSSDRLPEGLYTFGAPAVLLQAGFTPLGSLLMTTALLVAVGAWFVWRADARPRQIAPGMQADYLRFILGAAILTGSFAVTVNYAYRWVFAIWMIPFLCRAEAPATAPFLRQWLVATRWLLVLLLWIEMVGTLVLNVFFFPQPQPVMDRWGDLTNAVLQPVTWLLFASLAGWLTHFVVSQLRPATRPG